MQIRKINKLEKIELLSYKEILKKGLSKVKSGRIIFNALGLKNVITGLATIELCRIKIDDYKYLRRVFINISESRGTNPILKYTREYLERQFLVRDEITDYRFKKLLKKEYEIHNFLEDFDLNNFISEEILDELHLIRNWEYGNYCLTRLSNGIFEKVDVIAVEKFRKEMDNNNSDIIGRIQSQLENIATEELKEMNKAVYKYLILVFDRKFSAINNNMNIDYEYANFLKLKGAIIEKQYSLMVSTTEKIINNGFSKNRKKKKVRKL
jgi:hypothetical protein